ncbi:MAG TPA: glucose-6-phosphate dehydrogenase assembly protein OpcA [Dehalococcoidia bacterium]|nr:glucose-6-phosphate dehydrogenase assembly protein OpcA [Dehalococcoidia bacterium]
MAETVERAGRSLSWSGQAVDVDRIEEELFKLRYLAAGRTDGGYAVRTSLANMIVHAADDETAAYASRVIEELARHHPSRAQIIIANPSPEVSHIEASLAAHCHVDSGSDQSVCCEEVTLRVSGKAAHHLQSVIEPLLIPDLPVTVWWTGDFPDDTRLIEELCDLADHFIIDSSRFQDQIGDLVRARSLADIHDSEVGDLNFERLRPWRDIFDRYVESGGLREWLPAVAGIEIHYADVWGMQTSGQAALMLGWLAGRLGLDMTNVTRRGAQHMILGRDGRDVPAFVAPVGYDAVNRGWLVSIKVAFEGAEGDSAVFSMSRTADPLHVTILTQMPGCSREDHVRIEATDNPTILTRQLDAAPHDPEFKQLLAACTPLLEASRS